MGFYISFSGNLTFKNSHLPEIAKEIPLDKVMIETDSPFLSPVPFRGKPNEPGRTRFVAEKLAEIHRLPLEKIAEITNKIQQMQSHFSVFQNYHTKVIKTGLK